MDGQDSLAVAIWKKKNYATELNRKDFNIIIACSSHIICSEGKLRLRMEKKTYISLCPTMFPRLDMQNYLCKIPQECIQNIIAENKEENSDFHFIFLTLQKNGIYIAREVQLRVVYPPALAGCKGGKLTLHRHRHDDYYHRYTEPMPIAKCYTIQV
uniref:Uncharacterized protein n=1 Tax=Glossina pallidipes TaxID=7398 RepID=A0A1B0AE22_GLOPL